MARSQDYYKEGPSWHDVHEHLEEFRLATGRLVTVEMASTAAKREPTRLYVRVVSWTGWNGSTRLSEVARGSVWPCTDHRTMPGLLLSLLHKLDAHLTEEMVARERQSQF